MQDFIYYAPTRMVFGRNSLSLTSGLIKKGGYKKVLIHYGGESAKKSGLFDLVVAQVNESGASYVSLGGVSPNPKLSLIREGVELCKKENVDFILAVGGGSVIDSAKAIAIGAKMDQDIWTVFDRTYDPTEALPVACVLTLSAAGSEMSGATVVSNDETSLKRDYVGDIIRPVFSIENPEFSFSVSKYQTGCGAVDIMMHTLERYFAPDCDVPLTDEIAEAVLRTVREAGVIAYNEPNNYEARATLMWGSSITHNDLTGCGRGSDWATHMLEHDVSGMYDHVAHGAGLAAIFPSWARYVMDVNVDRFCRLANKLWGIEQGDMTKKEWAEKGIVEFEKHVKSIGMPSCLKELGVEEDKLEEIADMCSNNRTRTIGGFKILDRDDMLNIYKMAYSK